MPVPNPCYDPDAGFIDEYDYLPYLPEVDAVTNGLNLTVLAGIVISYIPQIWAIYKHKSTYGISMGTMHIANFSLLTSLNSFWMVSIQKFMACTESVERCYPSLVNLAQSFVMFAGVFWVYCLMIHYLRRESKSASGKGGKPGEDDKEALIASERGEESSSDASGPTATSEHPEPGAPAILDAPETSEAPATAKKAASKKCKCIMKPLVSEATMRKMSPIIFACFIVYMAVSACLTTSVGLLLGACSPVNTVVTYFYSFLAPILSIVQWLPQIIKTLILKDSGVFSLTMLCIQVPICVLMVVFMFLTEVSWLAAISAIVAALQMGFLTILIIHYRIKERRERKQKAAQAKEGDKREEKGEGESGSENDAAP